MKHLITFTVLVFALLGITHAADTFLVEDGQPRAEIIIAEKPARMARVAAQEFRQQMEKISGARLPIVTQSTGKAVKVFIGASAHSPVKAGRDLEPMLVNLAQDRGEQKDLSAQNPENKKELQSLFDKWSSTMQPPRWEGLRWNGEENRKEGKVKKEKRAKKNAAAN